jgi:hypothetical protein
MLVPGSRFLTSVSLGTLATLAGCALTGSVEPRWAGDPQGGTYLLASVGDQTLDPAAAGCREDNGNWLDCPDGVEVTGYGAVSVELGTGTSTMTVMPFTRFVLGASGEYLFELYLCYGPIGAGEGCGTIHVFYTWRGTFVKNRHFQLSPSQVERDWTEEIISVAFVSWEAMVSTARCSESFHEPECLALQLQLETEGNAQPWIFYWDSYQG